MANIEAHEKKTITSDFSPRKMIELAAESKQSARKYFFTKYFVPIAATVWFQQESSQAHSTKCNLHLLPRNGPNLMTYIAFEPANTTQSGSVRSASQDNSLNAVKKSIFGSSWSDDDPAMSNALMDAFDECLPERWHESLDSSSQILKCPLIAAATRIDSAEKPIKLHVLVKTKTNVRSEAALLNQGDSLDSNLMLKNSKKYRKLYNVITGNWVMVCDKNNPESICEECRVIYASPARDNVYDDPNFS